MSRLFPLSVILILSASALTQAADESWAGQTVMARRPDVKYIGYTSDGTEREVKMSEPMTRVLGDEDGWLRVHSPGTEAKVLKADMVLLRDAPDYYTEFLRDHGESAWAWDRRGIARRLRGEFDLGIKDFSEAIRLEPTAAYLNHRGSIWFAKKEFDKAIGDYDEAIRVDAKCASAFSNRGIAWWYKREPEKAMRDFDEAIRLEPKDVNALTNRGFALYLKKEYEKAIGDFDEAIRIDPKYAYAIGNKACALVKLKKYGESVQSFETAIQLNPVDWMYRDYAHLLASCPDSIYRNGKKAVELAKKAIELRRFGANSWEYQAALAAAYAETGEFEQAEAAQRKALEDKFLDAEDRANMEKRLELYRQKKPYRDQD
jgi:tetratricopeptide (TPR) repeat protein